MEQLTPDFQAVLIRRFELPERSEVTAIKSDGEKLEITVLLDHKTQVFEFNDSNPEDVEKMESFLPDCGIENREHYDKLMERYKKRRSDPEFPGMWISDDGE